VPTSVRCGRSWLNASAARSLFHVLKARRMVFANPARYLPAARRYLAVPVPLPLGTEARLAAMAAGSPRTQLVVALVGVHALTSSEITAIRLQDVSLHDMRLLVRGDDRPLDAFTATALASYLDWRRHQWPRTANPYLLVTRTTAGNISPVFPDTIRRWLKGITASSNDLQGDSRR
jgi:site-specific recombinase XerC